MDAVRSAPGALDDSALADLDRTLRDRGVSPTIVVTPAMNLQGGRQ